MQRTTVNLACLLLPLLLASPVRGDDGPRPVWPAPDPTSEQADSRPTTRSRRIISVFGP